MFVMKRTALRSPSIESFETGKAWEESRESPQLSEEDPAVASKKLLDESLQMSHVPKVSTGWAKHKGAAQKNRLLPCVIPVFRVNRVRF
jgi:hypothetical protein